MTAVPFSWLLAGADLLPALFLKTSLVLGAAALASLALRRASASARHFAWTVAVAAALVLPLGSWVVPFRLPVLPVVPALRAPAAAAPYQLAAETRLPDAASPAPFAATPEPGGAPSAAADAAGASGAFRLGLGKTLAALWLVGAGLILARLLAGFATVWYLSRRGERIDDPEWTSLAARLERRFSMRRRIRLVRTGWTEMPMTIGTLRPVVLLPMGADEWPAERREVVLTHELAHIARADVLVLALAQVVCALHWFNPLAWMALKNLRAEAERCCDDWVLRAGMRASSYAEHLLTMVHSVGRARVPSAFALPMAQRSTFEGRLLAILEPGVDRGPVGRGRAALATLAVAAVVALLAAVGPAAPDAKAAPVPGSSREALEPRAPVHAAAMDRESAVTVREGVGVRVAPQAPAPLAGRRAETERAAGPAEATARTAVALSGSPGGASAAVRESRVRAMGRREDPRAVAALVATLRTDPDARVRLAAAWALGRIEDARAVPALLEALSGDAEVAVRRAAARALGQIEHRAAVDGLIRAMRDADTELRATSVWALGAIEDVSAVGALTAALGDRSPGVRRLAARALGHISPSTAPPALVQALRDDDAETRRAAAWALGQIEDRSAAPALRALLRDADPEVRLGAVRTLAAMEDPAAAEALAELLRDRDPEVRAKAARAAGRHGAGPDARPEPRPRRMP